MAAFTQRGDKWRVLIRRKGHAPISKTFSLKSDAERWATKVERELETGEIRGLTELRAITVADILTKFRDEVVPNRKSWKFETNRINAYLSHGRWTNLSLADDIEGGIAAWRDKRLSEVKPQTIDRDFNLISAVFSHAIREWRLPMLHNPISRVSRPKKTDSGERDQVWAPGELETFLKEIGWSASKVPVGSSDYVGWVLLLCRETGMRLGSVCSIRVEDIHLDARYIKIHKMYVKNGDTYHCPLSQKAAATVKTLMDLRGVKEGKLLEVSATVAGELFRRFKADVAEKHPWAQDKVIHSLRHTFTTELVTKVKDQMTVMKITGRKNAASLMRYYRPKVSDLAKMMD